MRLNARLSAEHAAQLTQIQEQTQASVSEIIRRALEVYYQTVCKRPTSAKEVFATTGFMGCAEDEPELGATYKSKLASSWDQKHDPR